MIIHSGDHELSRGARRTVMGISCTYTVGLWLRGCCSRSHKYFFEALMVMDGSWYSSERPYNHIWYGIEKGKHQN